MQNSERHVNPALSCGLFEIDLVTLGFLKETILIVRREHLKEIRQWIDHIKDFVSSNNYQKLNKNCTEIEKKFIDELDKMGIDEVGQARMSFNIKKMLKTPLSIVGYAGKGLYEIIKVLGGQKGN